MKKVKFLNLMLLCVTVVLSFIACSNDEASLVDRVLSDVGDTKWLAVNGGDSYELKFEEGRYTLDYTLSDGKSYSITGTYSQNNREIIFQHKPFITYSIVTLKNGEISEYGSSITVPVFYDHSYADRDIAFTLKFTLFVE